MSDPIQPVCMTVVFSGRVQGVGFRYTTERIAREYAVTGYVRNLPDGRVEVLAEGKPDEVRCFLTGIEQVMGHYIRERTIVDGPAIGHYSNFSIRF